MTLMVMLLFVVQLMTFGIGNNDPAWVLEQHLQLGVTAAIVDDVPKVGYCNVVALAIATASPLGPLTWLRGLWYDTSGCFHYR